MREIGFFFFCDSAAMSERGRGGCGESVQKKRNEVFRSVFFSLLSQESKRKIRQIDETRSYQWEWEFN